MPRRSRTEIDEQRRLGKRIQHHRNRLGLTQSQVADHLDVPYQKVQRLERGTATLTIPRLLGLAKAFAIDPAELLRDLAEAEAQEPLLARLPLTEEEERLLAAWHRIDDRVQQRNILDLMERMGR